MFIWALFVTTALVASAVNVQELLLSMSLEEKVGQMTQLDFNIFVNMTTGKVNYEMMTQWFQDTKVSVHFDFYDCCLLRLNTVVWVIV